MRLFGKKPPAPACVRPFYCAEILESGDVTTCCYSFLKKPIGNIFEQTFEEIWNGKAAQNLRKKMLAGDLSPCNVNICGMRDTNGMASLGRELNQKDLSLS